MPRKIDFNASAIGRLPVFGTTPRGPLWMDTIIAEGQFGTSHSGDFSHDRLRLCLTPTDEQFADEAYMLSDHGFIELDAAGAEDLRVFLNFLHEKGLIS